MNKNEIMKIYQGWDKAEISAISKYIDKFEKPYPVYASRDVEFINYCIDHNISVDDFDSNDPIYKKYNPTNVIY